MGLNNKALSGEHSIGVQVAFIKLVFPEARLVPLIFKTEVSQQLITDITKILSQYQDQITVVASVDFSHYQTASIARIHDTASKQMLTDFNFDSFTVEYADSPACLKLLGRLIQSFGADEISVLKIANSSDFTKQTTNTTGYINALFKKP